MSSSAWFRARRILICSLCMLASSRTAAAEWHITPMLGVTFAGRTTLFDPQVAVDKKHADFGGAVTLLGAGVVGAETIVVFTPGFFQTDKTPLATETSRVEIKSSRVVAMMGNAVLTTPRRWTEYSLRPFLSGGLGILHATETQKLNALPLVHPGMAGFNLGGGAVGFLTKRTGVRFDLRYYRSLRGPDPSDPTPGTNRLHYMTASVGLVLRRH